MTTDRARSSHSFLPLILIALLVCMNCFTSDVAAAAEKGLSSSSAAPLLQDSSLSVAYKDAAGDTDSVSISKEGDQALSKGASFGFADFIRLNKGTDRAYNGTYYGYQYSMASQDAFIAIAVPDTVAKKSYVIVYIPAQRADSLNIDIADKQFQKTFAATLLAEDSENANGGVMLSALKPAFVFTSENSVRLGKYTYSFPVQIEDGYYYGTVKRDGSKKGVGGALFAESGTLHAASELNIAQKPTGLAAFAEFLANLDWRPLWVSLKTTGVALAFIFVFGILAAWATINATSRLKGVLDTIFTIPMVLPPTVVGFLLLMLFGRSTAIGRWLIAHGIDIVFTWPAAVIACAVVGFPLLYRTARGAFENLDSTMLDAARTLGWTEGRIFRQLMMPLAWPSIAAGTVLGFARAMGEFGATLFFAGNFAGVTQTLPIAIYYDWMAGDTDAAIFWVVVVILISFLVILFINIYSSRTQRYRIGGDVSHKRRKHGKDRDANDNTVIRAGQEADGEALSSLSPGESTRETRSV